MTSVDKGGRPWVGPPITVCISPELAEAVAALRRPGESRSACIRRQLESAPEIAKVLRISGR